MGLGKQIRLNRLFAHPSGRFCSVAVDHFVGYAGKMHPGLANLPKAIAEVVAGGPDAVTAQKGAALSCWGPHAGKVPLILQAGCFTQDDRISEIVTDPEECVRMGADAIAIAIGVRGSSEGRYIKFLADGVAAAARYDLPVIAHIYPRRFSSSGVTVLHEPDEIFWATRVGIECGADVVKVPYTGDPTSYGQIVDVCPVPLVAAGGPKTETLEDALESMAGVVASGARGATIGRNVWGHGEIGVALAAFKGVIHDRLCPSDALARATRDSAVPA